MITSTANRQVKQLIQLNRKKKARDEQGVFVAEGPRMLQEAPPDRIVKTYFSESWYEANKTEIDKILSTSPVQISFEIMQDNVFRAACDTESPQGVTTIVRRRENRLDDMLSSSAPLLLVLENIQDPGNLGTILRTAEGAGVTGVLLTNNCVDLYNPKTVRSTMGSIYRVPVCKAGDCRTVIAGLQAAGIRSYAAHLDGRSFYDEPDYTGGTAFLIGNESAGLSEGVAKAADQLIRIPMEGRLESLNVSVAASLLIYEAYRQRRRNGQALSL